MVANPVVDNSKEITEILKNSKRDSIIARLAFLISIISLIVAILK